MLIIRVLIKRYILVSFPEISMKDVHNRLLSYYVRSLDQIIQSSELLGVADQLRAATYNSSTIHLQKSKSLLDIILRLK